MAKRSSHRRRHHRRHGLVVRARSIKPVIVRTTKVVKAHAKRHFKRGSGSLFSQDRIMTVASGFAVGMLEKLDFVKSLPHLPFIGTTGTIGMAAYLFSNGGRNKIAADIATAALTVAGYQLGATGSIVGEEVDVSGYVAGY
jgi:hypothetical protein